MATLWIREFDKAGEAPNGEALPIPMEGSTRDQTVTFTTSAQSAAFNASTQYIAMISTVAFHYKVSSNPTATTSHLLVPANTMLFIGIEQGSLKVAAVAAA
jgi:hypothetical protein